MRSEQGGVVKVRIRMAQMSMARKLTTVVASAGIEGAERDGRYREVAEDLVEHVSEAGLKLWGLDWEFICRGGEEISN